MGFDKWYLIKGIYEFDKVYLIKSISAVTNYKSSSCLFQHKLSSELILNL